MLFRCDEYDQSYSSTSALRERRTARHVAIQNHVCDVDNCGKAYGLALQLRDHKVSVHNKVGYICSICQKKSRSTKNLNRHTRKRKGDTPYACTYPGCHLNPCNHTSSSNIVLIIHTFNAVFVSITSAQLWKDTNTK